MESLVETLPDAQQTLEKGHPPAGESSAGKSHVRLAVWVFVAFQFLYMFTSTGRARTADEYNTFYTIESLVLHGSTAVPQALQLHNFYGRLDLAGDPQAAYPPGHAFLSTPWYAVGNYVLARLPGVPADDTDLIVGFASCLSSATFAALTVGFFFLLLTGIGVSPKASLLPTALVGVATPLFGYSGWLFSEPLSAAVLMAAAWILFGRGANATSLRAALAAGALLGLSTWIRPTNVLAIAIFALAVLVRDGKPGLRAAIALGAASAVGVVALLFRDMALFGNPFDFGYPTEAGGVKIGNTFDTPLTKGLYGFLLSPGKSVVLYAPPVILAAAGLRRLWKLERGVAAVATLVPVVYLIFFARYSSWEGGYCVGPRYLVPSIALFCLALGPILAGEKSRARLIAWLLLGVGGIVQCVTLATSFLEDQAQRGRYYDATWHYNLGYSLGGQVDLFLKYLHGGQPAVLGRGWDRWFVFLHNGGIATGTLVCMGAVMLAGLAVGLAGLARNIRTAS